MQYFWITIVNMLSSALFVKESSETHIYQWIVMLIRLETHLNVCNLFY